ncbi:MAG: M48 family metalloprotease [Desulfobulbaceae bacterium]|nr:M48 family metalloprotease [Desulfobulbaceae bacterium]
MIYSNLIYLLVVMAILATSTTPEGARLPEYQFIALFAIKLGLFRWLIRFSLNRSRISRVSDYFSLERNLAVLALVLFGVDVYLLDLRYYLNLLPFTAPLPSLAEFAGIVVFLFYMILLWTELKPGYEEVVGVRKKTSVHVRDKLKVSIALVLPWLVVNFMHDLLQWLPIKVIRDFMASPWGEPLFLLVMISVAVIWFPALLVRLFGCTAMPEGDLRSRIEKFSRRQGVRFGEICLWPIVEGKVLTAGVVGFVGRHRYLMITPALLQSLSEEELEAVVAHEIGHVKKHHLLLYILLFLGFALLIQLCVQPLLVLLLSAPWFYEFLYSYEGDPVALLAILTGGPLLVAALVYFRYVFGFFMRNFERQADHYSFRVMGSVAPLISVFRKISLMSGQHRDVPCWHHFSIGQRIDNLLSCQRDDKVPAGHNRKVYTALAAYFMVIAAAFALTLHAGERLAISSSGQLVAEQVILEKIERDPNNPLWHQFHGDLLASREQSAKAIKAFERSLELAPDNPEALNNLAWLLLTGEDQELRDSDRALELARKAAKLQPRSHILDTLAEAYWQNGMAELALETGRRALENSIGNREYYRRQLEKFDMSDQS